MNTFINGPVLDALSAGPASTVLGFAGLIAIVVLLILLIMKEIARTRGGTKTQTWLETLDIAVIPLLGAVGLVILKQIFNIIRP